MEKELANYLEALNFLSESTEDYLFLWNFSTRRVYFTDAIYEKYEFTREEDGGHLPEAIEQLVYFRDLSVFRKLLQNLESGSIASCNTEVRLVDKTGNIAWYSFRGTTHFNEEGIPRAMMGTVSDGLINKSVDSLTGVLNESRFLKDMDECLKKKKRGFLMVVGIDDFKNINIKYGREYGNYILKNMAEIMEEVVDAYLDIYRLGGDLYAVNLLGCSESVVQAVYLSFREKLEPYCTVSAGAVSYGIEIVKDSDTLYQYAEAALDHAKKKGKNKLKFFSSEDYENNLCEIELLGELRNSVTHGFEGFSLCYQPQFSCKDHRIVGVEALLRYESPNQGKISPEKFIPILEQTELIVPVGEWVLETALKQCKQWRKHLPQLHISVNISYVQLCMPKITENVLGLLQEVDIPGESLILEITESMQLQDYQYFNKIFYTWRRYGIQIAIDDFGTGYSSWEYLKNMEINEIKLDRCMVSHIHRTAYNYRLIGNIIELAHSAQIRVCCEGVELKEELLALKELDADIIQGYLLAKPYSARMFEAYYIEKEHTLYQQRIDQFQKLHTETGIRNLSKSSEKGDITIILDSIDDVIYVSDVDSYELYYLNPAGRTLTGIHDYKGKKCYKVLQGRNNPCEFCTNHKLEKEKFYVWEMENDFYKRHFVLKDKLIPWQGKMARMEIAIDITKRECVNRSIQNKLKFEENKIFG